MIGDVPFRSHYGRFCCPEKIGNFKICQMGMVCKKSQTITNAGNCSNITKHVVGSSVCAFLIFLHGLLLHETITLSPQTNTAYQISNIKCGKKASQSARMVVQTKSHGYWCCAVYVQHVSQLSPTGKIRPFSLQTASGHWRRGSRLLVSLYVNK